MKFILCGNLEEFRNYCHENNLDSRPWAGEAVYLTGLHQMMGRINIKIIKYGTWYKREDVQILLNYAEARKLKQKL